MSTSQDSDCESELGDEIDVGEQRRYRERSPEKPVLGMLADCYAEWYLDFCPTGDTTRTELAEVFFEKAREAAERYVEMEECSRPAAWNDWTRDPESRHWMEKHLDERRAWAQAIDYLWQYSRGETVDADALREALIRQSFRCHSRGGRRDRNEEHIFVKAAGIVREKAGLDRMPDARSDAARRDYL